MVPFSRKIRLNYISELWWMLIRYLQVAQGASDVGLAWIYKEKFQ